MKRYTITAIIVVVVILLAGTVLLSIRAHADPRQKLIDFYHPGTCFGMPGPSLSPGGNQPDITLKPTLTGWNYTVNSGACCDTTQYQGTISDFGKIKETGQSYGKMPC